MVPMRTGNVRDGTYVTTQRSRRDLHHSLFAEGRFKISSLDGKLDVEQSLLRHVEHEPLMMLQSLRRCLHHQLTLRVIATLT